MDNVQLSKRICQFSTIHQPRKPATEILERCLLVPHQSHETSRSKHPHAESVLLFKISSPTSKTLEFQTDLKIHAPLNSSFFTTTSAAVSGSRHRVLQPILQNISFPRPNPHLQFPGSSSSSQNLFPHYCKSHRLRLCIARPFHVLSATPAR